MRYELTDLRLFLEIAQAKSLTAAAAALFITSSAASYRLKNLEQALGTPLFERNSRGMELTRAGEAVLAHVRDIFENVERMQGDVRLFISGIKGHVRIIANSSSLNSFVTQTLGRFLVAHPGIDADVEERQSETIPAAVLAREADIGIFAGKTDVQGLAIHPYAIDELVIVAPPEHEVSTRPSVRLCEALDFEFVCMHRDSSNYLFLRDAAARQGRTVTARLHAQGFEAVLSLVAAGVGVAMVPSSVLEHRQAPHRVARLALEEPWARRELNLAVRADARFPDFIKACVDFLLDDPLVAATRQASGGEP
jgi:DNA-binding transcriptional LysR family regulator